MKWPGRAWQAVRDPRSGWLWMLSVFLIGLGARLWLIRRFGTPLPFWDQWEEARVVYLPYLEGKLSVADLFSAHNEHRIFFSRIYGLALLLLNRQWDGQLEMVCDAVIHCATLAGLGWLMCRRLARQQCLLAWLPLVLLLALPFGWENTLAGFQSIFYFFLLLSLLTLWLLGLHPPGSVGWWCGAAAAIMALFTLASGFMAAATVFALVLLRIWRRPEAWKQQAVTMAFCAAVVASGLLLKVDVPHHSPLQAHSVGEFLAAFGANLAWPWIVVPPFALLNLVPLGVLAYCYLRRGEERPAAEMTLAIGLWTVLQAAATAYARGAEGRPPGWRYMDSTSLIVIANGFSLAILLSRRWPTPAASGILKFSVFNFQFSIPCSISRLVPLARPILLSIVICWGLVCIAGLALLSSRAWQIDIPERRLYHRAQLKHARAFLATDDVRVFEGKPRCQLLCYQGDPLAPTLRYEAEWTVEYLRNPLIRRILPACARLPLRMEPDLRATQGFVTNGVRPDWLTAQTLAAWSSWSAPGPAATGTFESLPIQKSRFPYLEIAVAGGLGEEGLSLELVDVTSGKRKEVRSRRFAVSEWQSCHVKAPAGEFKIVAQDASETGWLAFQPPRELGRLSLWAIQLLGAAEYLLFAGLGLLLLNLAALLASRHYINESQPDQ